MKTIARLLIWLLLMEPAGAPYRLGTYVRGRLFVMLPLSGHSPVAFLWNGKTRVLQIAVTNYRRKRRLPNG